MSKYVVILYILALIYYIKVFAKAKYRSNSRKIRALDLLAVAFILWISGRIHVLLNIDPLELAGLILFAYAVIVVSIEQFIIAYKEN
jgi:hypothetical protein